MLSALDEQCHSVSSCACLSSAVVSKEQCRFRSVRRMIDASLERLFHAVKAVDGLTAVYGYGGPNAHCGAEESR